MRVLYIATSFPEPHQGATIYTDLAEALHEAGHNITVVVSEQKKNKQYTEIGKERGFDVLRIVTGNYYDVSLIEKGITTLKIPFLMKRSILKYLSKRTFDFILYEAPPVTNANLVLWAKKKYGCPSYLMLKDIFPQNAIDLGIIKKNSILFYYFKCQEKLLYKSADIIGCMSEANKQYIIDHNPWLDGNKIEIFPNTKKLTNSYLILGNNYRDKYSIPKDACVFLFGGNMGKPQYIDLLCQVIFALKDDKNMYFLFVGRGTERYKLENAISENHISNAQVVGNMPRDEYEKITMACDVGLITLDPRFTIPNYPSRILSYMEYAKPILAATDKVTDLRLFIEAAKCGEWVWSGDLREFIEKVKKISVDPERKQMGQNGRIYMEKYLCITRSIKLIENHLINSKVENNDVTVAFRDENSRI